MTSREQTLAIIFLVAIVLVVGGVGGYVFIVQPLQKQRDAEDGLNKEIADLEQQVEAQKDVAKRLEIARKRSLPADDALARREYMVALERLAETAGVPKGYSISAKPVDNSARAVPQIAKDKPVYTKIAYEVIFKKADTWMIKDFLEGYYQLGLLQQITAISIKKDDDPGSKNANAGRRNDLTVTLTTEAIIVEGAENRRTLLAVPTAFAAIGGGAAYKGLTLTPEAARGVVPELFTQVLSPVGRDYRLMVQKDPFNGPLPPPPEFAVAKISDVEIETDKRPSPVRVALSGVGSDGAKVAAIASGTLFATGELKVEQKGYYIELPRTSATEGTSTIEVIATSSEGVRKTTSFKVTVKPPKKEVVVDNSPTEDISPFVVLIGVTQRSDGTAWARILDNANRTRYQIEVNKFEFWGIPISSFLTVAKEEIAIPRKGWTPVAEHKYDLGVMVVSDPKSKTYRMFKVIAVDHDGLFLADLKPDATGPPKRPDRPAGMWPPKGPVKQGPGNPLAALGGNMIAVGPPPAPPKYYRWTVGQTLAAIKQVPDSEAKKIIKMAEETGPVLNVAIADTSAP